MVMRQHDRCNIVSRSILEGDFDPKTVYSQGNGKVFLYIQRLPHIYPKSRGCAGANFLKVSKVLGGKRLELLTPSV